MKKLFPVVALTMSILGCFEGDSFRTPQVLWEKHIGGDFSYMAISDDGTVYFMGVSPSSVEQDGEFQNYYQWNLYAVNPNGKEKWVKTFGESWNLYGYSSPLVASDGTIYIASMEGFAEDFGSVYLFAITPEGRILWKKAGFYPCALGSNDEIFCKNDYGELWKFEADGSNPKYLYGMGTISGYPSIGQDGNLYCSVYEYDDEMNLNCWIAAIEGDGGGSLWEYPLPGYIPCSSPAIGPDGTIYWGVDNVNDYGGVKTYYLYAMNPNGTLKWKFETEDAEESHRGLGSPVIDESGRIYVGRGKSLYVLNPDGSLDWKFSAESYVHSPVICTEGFVIFAADYLYALDQDGNLVWKYLFAGVCNISNKGRMYLLPLEYEDYGMSGHYLSLFCLDGSAGGLANSSWPKLRHDAHNSCRVGFP